MFKIIRAGGNNKTEVISKTSPDTKSDFVIRKSSVMKKKNNNILKT